MGLRRETRPSGQNRPPAGSLALGRHFRYAYCRMISGGASPHDTAGHESGHRCLWCIRDFRSALLAGLVPRWAAGAIRPDANALWGIDGEGGRHSVLRGVSGRRVHGKGREVLLCVRVCRWRVMRLILFDATPSTARRREMFCERNYRRSTREAREWEVESPLKVVAQWPDLAIAG